jgi:PKD repeat protein
MLFGIGTCILLLLGTIMVVADDDTFIRVEPLSQIISSGNTFPVNVSCTPDQPIKAFGFKMLFNPSLLKANSVTEGDIFAGYQTFFSPGTIDNNAGTIVGVYCLILGSENISNNGTFVTISFTAKDKSGTSSLDLYDVDVSDEIGFVTINVYNGSITVQGSNSGGEYFPPIGDGDGIPIGDENEPPDTPIKPSGPTFIEVGVEYVYTSLATDIDGDKIRYRFDWGDGNISNWSDFIPSNIPLSLSHKWNSIDTYIVRILAQDENRLNSSWSLPLNVTVSQLGFEGKPPVADFSVSNNTSVYQAIVFDAYSSYDDDGVIVTYYWDFGDGENGSGISPSHIYQNPGEYTVTLSVIDNNGNAFSKSRIITIASEVKEGHLDEQKILLPISLIIILIVSVVILLICLIAFFKGDTIKTFVSSHQITKSPRWKIMYFRRKKEKDDAGIEEEKKKRVTKTDFKKSAMK